MNVVKNIAIIGGGTAGWLTAAILASDYSNASLNVTVVEAPDIKPIGVGEGTWPSMRSTLKRIGVLETDFIRECCVSFKQGTCFYNWASGKNEYYYHPFSLPAGFPTLNLADTLPSLDNFAAKVTEQGLVCDNFLAPKQIATPEYAYVLNYGYHLDSVKFSAFLQKHCVQNLQVNHILSAVAKINNSKSGDIANINLENGSTVAADIFVDCSGFKSLLLGQHFGIAKHSVSSVLFNDTALAVQIPYKAEDDLIASTTKSSAQKAGWIWDIGLPSRKGVGYVYSSSHSSELEAKLTLQNYIALSLGSKQASEFEFRKLKLDPGYRTKLWHKNCVAIGLAAGFVEPLEASALVLVELCAQMLSEQLPTTTEIIPIVAKKFNDRFLLQWQRIIDFLKLHYVLSKRKDSDYWLDNKQPSAIPLSLQEQLALWQHRVPWHCDLMHSDDLFPPASFQYILYGMGFKTNKIHSKNSSIEQKISYAKQADIIRDRGQKMLGALPTNRQLYNAILQKGLPI